MEEKMYYLMKNPECNEIHIFEMKFIRIEDNDRIYDFYPKSDKLERYKCICKAFEHTRMAKITNISKSKLLGNEIDIRKECAEIGRPVCGGLVYLLFMVLSLLSS